MRQVRPGTTSPASYPCSRNVHWIAVRSRLSKSWNMSNSTTCASRSASTKRAPVIPQMMFLISSTCSGVSRVEIFKSSCRIGLPSGSRPRSRPDGSRLPDGCSLPSYHPCREPIPRGQEPLKEALEHEDHVEGSHPIRVGVHPGTDVHRDIGQEPRISSAARRGHGADSLPASLPGLWPGSTVRGHHQGLRDREGPTCSHDRRGPGSRRGHIQPRGGHRGLCQERRDRPYLLRAHLLPGA